MLTLGLVLAALIGLSLGLVGGGGSILTVPVLVYLLGYDPKAAIAMSLPIVGVTSLVGAALHWQRGNVRVRTALVFGAIAMAGAFGGARLSLLLSGTAQLTLLAAVMLAAGVSMLRGSSDAEHGTLVPPAPRLPLLLAALGVGTMTGVVGIGGGFLIVPALVHLARVPMREAVGTSLLVIAMSAAFGFAGHLGTVPLDWSFLAAFTLVAVVGALAGTAGSRRVSPRTLKHAFAVLVFVVGGFVLYENRRVFQSSPDASSMSQGLHGLPTAAARQPDQRILQPREWTCSSGASTTPNSPRRAI